jgi:MFS family permease
VRRLAAGLAVDRNTGAVAAATLLMTLGEELWKRFLPAYLLALGAPGWGVGAYGSTRDLLDGCYQYPGGWLADRWGRPRALQAFVGLALVGYTVLALAPAWPVAVAGAALAMGWSSMASPALFAVIGDALATRHRAMGFSVQAIVRRLPILVAPAIGGLLILRFGAVGGVQRGLAASGLLALGALAALGWLRLPGAPRAPRPGGVGVWRAMPRALRRLLSADILVRTCEALADVFLVVYALEVVRVGAARYGLLVTVQMATAIVCYLPAAQLAASIGRTPLIVATFAAFAAFPLAVAAASSFSGLVAAFVVGGLRELGEPARKALIVDLAHPEARARSVGLYYLIRGLAITPAATVGGLLWQRSHALPFLVAGAVGLLGTATFALGRQRC